MSRTVARVEPEQGTESLRPSARRSSCKWKGRAGHHSVVGERTAADAAWRYPCPPPPFATIAGYLAFYPSKIANISDARRHVKDGVGLG